MSRITNNPLTILLVLISLNLGIIAGNEIGDPIVGLAVGVVTALGMLLMLRSNAMLWLMGITVIIMFAVATLLCFPYGYIYSLLAMVLGVLIGAYGLQHLFRADVMKAITYLFVLALGQPISSQVVKEPVKLVEGGKPEELGPQTITVKPETAVVLETGAKQTAIVGPSVFRSAPFEYVKRIYSLRPHHETYQLSQVLTHDMIPTRTKVGITYGLDVEEDARTGQRSLTNNEQAAINLFGTRADNWGSELESLVEEIVRQELARDDFDVVMTVGKQQLIEANIQRRLTNTTRDWGLRIYRVNLVHVQPHQGIPSAKKENWLVTSRSETLRQYEIERAKAWAKSLQVVNEAYVAAIEEKGPNIVIYQELARRMIAQAASDSVTMSLVPRELRRLLTDAESRLTDLENEIDERQQKSTAADSAQEND